MVARMSRNKKKNSTIDFIAPFETTVITSHFRFRRVVVVGSEG